MSDRTLPPRAEVSQLRRQANELLAAAGESEPLTPAAARLALAREYGFASWTLLVEEVERRGRERVEEFLRASVLGTGGAEQMLRDEPAIAGFGLYPALVLGDEARVRELIARDPMAAVRPHPESGWPPLLG